MMSGDPALLAGKTVLLNVSCSQIDRQIQQCPNQNPRRLLVETDRLLPEFIGNTRTCDNQNNFEKENKLRRHSDMILKPTIKLGNHPGWGDTDQRDAIMCSE